MIESSSQESLLQVMLIISYPHFSCVKFSHCGYK